MYDRQDAGIDVYLHAVELVGIVLDCDMENRISTVANIVNSQLSSTDESTTVVSWRYVAPVIVL